MQLVTMDRGVVKMNHMDRGMAMSYPLLCYCQGEKLYVKLMVGLLS